MTVKNLKEELSFYDDDAEVVFELDDDVEVESTTVNKYGYTTVHIDSNLKPTFIRELNGDCNITLISVGIISCRG